MSKEKAREIQRKLRRLNREGGYLYTDDMCLPIERVYVVDASDDILMVYWLDAGFPSSAGSDRPGGHLRALKQIEVRQTSDDGHNGEQVLEFFGVHAGEVSCAYFDSYFGRLEEMPKEELESFGVGRTADYRFVIASKDNPPDHIAGMLRKSQEYWRKHRKECMEFEEYVARKKLPDYDFIMS